MASGTAVFVRQGRALAEVMAPRTAAIDEAIERAAHRQVVLVGAGLDGRPWRLASLREATAFSVDHPAPQADARARSAEPTPAGRLVSPPSTWRPSDSIPPSPARDTTPRRRFASTRTWIREEVSDLWIPPA